jgi:hypothetical protein
LLSAQDSEEHREKLQILQKMLPLEPESRRPDPSAGILPYIPKRLTGPE